MSRSSLLRAVITQRCPVCRDGPMFRSMTSLYDKCPVCGHRFMREPGFFQGAMYVSYALSLGQFVVLALLAQTYVAPHLGRAAGWVAAITLQLLLVPMLYRYSRVLWAHLNVATR